MLVKSFRAESVTDALARVRAALGPDACVLETRREGDVVEVVAAAERPRPDRAHSLDGFPSSDSPALPSASREGVESRAALRRTLLASLPRESPGDPLDAGPYVQVLVGPSGAGKTTMAAKLAHRAREAGKRRVIIASLDRDRVGGLEQCAALARSLRVRFAAPPDPPALSALRARLDARDAIIVDTPGLSRGDVARRAALARELVGFEPGEIELLVPLDRSASVLEDFVARYAPLRPGALGGTRLDEADSPALLVSLSITHGLPLRHLGTGPRIAQDLESATPESIVERLLEGQAA